MIQISMGEVQEFGDALKKAAEKNIQRLSCGDPVLSREEEILGALIRRDPIKFLFIFDQAMRMFPDSIPSFSQN